MGIQLSVCCTDRVKSYMDKAQIDRALFRKASSGSVRVTIKTEDGSLCLTGWEAQYWGLNYTSCQLRIRLCWSVVAACSEIIILNSKRHISRTTMETQRGSVCLTGWSADTPGSLCHRDGLHPSSLVTRIFLLEPSWVSLRCKEMIMLEISV